MSAQKERARAAWAGSGDLAGEAFWYEMTDQIEKTEFLGYETLSAFGQVMCILENAKQLKKAVKGQEVELVFNQTPFYAESGGQVADIGRFVTETGSGIISSV